MFAYRGNILTSKSWLNRALIIQHFNPDLILETESGSEDVIALKKSLQSLAFTNVFDLGMGGTSFRFFSFLISRRPGDWILRAHERLLERPQQEIISVLLQLGVKAEFNGSELHIHSKGWKSVSKVTVGADISSQFISGLLLSCWKLDNDLEIEVRKPISSFGYLRMTTELLKNSGLNIQTQEKENSFIFTVFKNQEAQAIKLESELDISSVFSLISAAVINGKVEITNWNKNSIQPDLIFLEIIKKMNISYRVCNNIFSIEKHNNWRGIDYNLNNSPDLFPVLAVLCAFGDGSSTLSGAAQLKHKESDRIKKTDELLRLVGVKTDRLADGLRIDGNSSIQNKAKLFKFNPDHDHRMAMAAALVKLKGYNIEISDPAVVNKSYPDFWKDIGL